MYELKKIFVMQYPALYFLTIDTIKLRELLRKKGQRHTLMHIL
jgi:hypothetical protein